MEAHMELPTTNQRALYTAQGKTPSPKMYTG